MTKEDFEKNYGEFLSVSSSFSYETLEPIVPYFEELNRIIEDAGKKPYSFSVFVATVLEVGCLPLMLKNCEDFLDWAKSLKKGDNHD